MTVMPPSAGAPQVITAGPTDEQIMEVIGLTSTSTEQFCQRLRDLFGNQTRIQSLAHMQAEILEVNQANGWFDSDRTVGDDIALLHTEVSEMFEAFRESGLDDATVQMDTNISLPKPEGFGSECADVLIRLLDTCERRGVDLQAEYQRKISFNRTRGYRHGGKAI
jgi:NTP pyrophosphatase (non-canonical NTP hydrolase)